MKKLLILSRIITYYFTNRYVIKKVFLNLQVGTKNALLKVYEKDSRNYKRVKQRVYGIKKAIRDIFLYPKVCAA